MTNSKSRLTNRFHVVVSLIVPAFSICLALLFAEITFRSLLFSETSLMRPLKRPEFYANDWDGDYFKLRHFMNEKYKEPSDKVLGWTNPSTVVSKTYTHTDDPKIGNRTPVLLYGDSFAVCHTSKDECFQGMLNREADFKGTHHLVNYGVSGYGIDQVYLLYTKTIDYYRSPLVIVGILNYDLDRSYTPVTWGLKPFFRVEEGRLKCYHSHLTSNIDDFFFHNPPTIVSYLWRLFVHAGPLPKKVAGWFKSREERRIEIRAISEAILLEMSEDMKRRGIPHVFIIFEWPERMIDPPDWRVHFLIELFRRNDIDFILPREAIIGGDDGSMFCWEKYVVGDGHPNASYNRLVCEQIRSWLVGLRQRPKGM